MLCCLRQVDTPLLKGEGSFGARRITRRTSTVLVFFLVELKSRHKWVLSNHCWRRHLYPVSVVDCRWLIQSFLLKQARKGLLSLSAKFVENGFPLSLCWWSKRYGKALYMASTLAVCSVLDFCLSVEYYKICQRYRLFVAYPVFSLSHFLLSGFSSYSSQRAPCIYFSYECVWCNQAACPVQQSVNSLWDQSKHLLV